LRAAAAAESDAWADGGEDEAATEGSGSDMMDVGRSGREHEDKMGGEENTMIGEERWEWTRMGFLVAAGGLKIRSGGTPA
jgi:hypothetical protein